MGVLWVGIRASLLAFICGPLRGIPWYWQVIDSSFGVGSILPLLLAIREVRKLER